MVYRGYANYTDQGWNLRFHGNVYKQPNTNESKLNDLANVFLIGTSVQDLPPSQASQARNLTAEIFVAQQGNQNVTFSLAPAPTAGATGTDGGAIEAPGGAQIVRFPYETTDEGDFDDFVQIQSNGLLPGNATNHVQVLNVYTQGADLGNATAWLVPDTGFTIISDIDDILRVTKIYEPKEGLLNSFARPFTPWMNMPEIYANWSASIPDFHFHYLTTTPEQVTRNYMDFIYNTYPGGSFDTRPLNFSNVEETLKVRKVLLEKIFQTYPKRKFILIADTSNSDVMTDYPMMATEFPGQVQCIFLRNTTATDPGDRFPYDTSGFKDLNQQTYMFFLIPVRTYSEFAVELLLTPFLSLSLQDDLKNLDIVNGQCLNTTIPQNVTFSIQGLPFGLSKSNATNKSAAVPSHSIPSLWRWCGWGLLTLGVWAAL